MTPPRTAQDLTKLDPPSFRLAVDIQQSLVNKPTLPELNVAGLSLTIDYSLKIIQFIGSDKISPGSWTSKSRGMFCRFGSDMVTRPVAVCV